VLAAPAVRSAGWHSLSSPGSFNLLLFGHQYTTPASGTPSALMRMAKCGGIRNAFVWLLLHRWLKHQQPPAKTTRDQTERRSPKPCRRSLARRPSRWASRLQHVASHWPLTLFLLSPILGAVSLTPSSFSSTNQVTPTRTAPSTLRRSRRAGTTTTVTPTTPGRWWMSWVQTLWNGDPSGHKAVGESNKS